jgi:hypothetical protein
MGLVAVTAGLFALGAYLGRDMSYGWGWAFFIAAFGVPAAPKPAMKSAVAASPARA